MVPSMSPAGLSSAAQDGIALPPQSSGQPTLLPERFELGQSLEAFGK